jgi:hypothetical protein
LIIKIFLSYVGEFHSPAPHGIPLAVIAPVRPLADGFFAGRKDAVKDRWPFNPRTGLPVAEGDDHAREDEPAEPAAVRLLVARHVGRARSWSAAGS